MHRRARTRLACEVALLAALAGSCGGGADDDGAMPPSVIVISLDTLRGAHTSFGGYERDTTPFLKSLAGERGIVFERAYSVAPWTLISHITMLTGLYPEQHGVTEAKLALSPAIPFLAQRLDRHGYRTLGLYKKGFVAARYGFERGFDVFRDHRDAAQADAHLREELAKLPSNRPFFLFLHLFDVHADPMHAPGDLMYRPPPPFDRAYVPDAAERLAGVDFEAVKLEQAEPLTPAQLEALVALYDGKIRYVDSMLERWFGEWRAQGLLDDTLVIVTSDHGEALGTRDGGINGHGRMFEEGLHIPMLVLLPDGRRAGERDARLASLVDVVPTVLDVVGLDADPRLPGFSLAGELPAERVIGAHRPPLSACLRGPWKVTHGGTLMSLVNLAQDPGERDPIVRGDRLYETQALPLIAAFEALLATCPPFDGAQPIPAGAAGAAMVRELEALGYAGGEDEE